MYIRMCKLMMYIISCFELVHKYLCGSTLVWYSSKHGVMHIGRLHCLHMYVVVFLPRPLFLLHTVHSVCLFFPDSVQGRLSGK